MKIPERNDFVAYEMIAIFHRTTKCGNDYQAKRNQHWLHWIVLLVYFHS